MLVLVVFVFQLGGAAFADEKTAVGVEAAVGLGLRETRDQVGDGLVRRGRVALADRVHELRSRHEAGAVDVDGFAGLHHARRPFALLSILLAVFSVRLFVIGTWPVGGGGGVVFDRQLLLLMLGAGNSVCCNDPSCPYGRRGRGSRGHERGPAWWSAARSVGSDRCGAGPHVVQATRGEEVDAVDASGGDEGLDALAHDAEVDANGGEEFVGDAAREGVAGDAVCHEGRAPGAEAVVAEPCADLDRGQRREGRAVRRRPRR
mmetsp:Transcript_1477/g.4344  ORF Transcript_1477/g.4344 Transcript_1477/m.4344 type:complete len:261 (+) Transcript_1477:961-1743(+)